MDAKDFLAPAGTLPGFFIVNFIAESYKRFKSGSVLAAGLAGELKSYLPAQSMLIGSMDTIISAHTPEGAEKLSLAFRGEFEMPKDRVYEANVASIGLLGAELAAATAEVYGRILGFRTAYRDLHNHYGEMNVHESRERARFIKGWLETCKDAGERLIPQLEKRAKASWFAERLNTFDD